MRIIVAWLSLPLYLPDTTHQTALNVVDRTNETAPVVVVFFFLFFL